MLFIESNGTQATEDKYNHIKLLSYERLVFVMPKARFDERSVTIGTNYDE